MQAKQKKNSPAVPQKQNHEKFALISVSDKTGVVEFAQKLASLGYKIISTGGTAKTLLEQGLKVIPIQEITGNPESFDGRMKTISFQVESGILFDRSNKKHVQEAQNLKIKPIDIVVANLYPFEKTVGNNKSTFAQTVEQIDVGGPTMVRAAAKNHAHVLVVVDPGDYERLLSLLEQKKIDSSLRQELAGKAFSHLSFYDAQVARFLRSEPFPQEMSLAGRNGLTLRYGENPHQKSTVYFEPNTNSPLKNLQRLTGRELSYVNFTDISAGLECVRVFDEPAAVVIKHNSPSGIALGKTADEALKRAVAADPESAFGGVIVLNSPLDLKTAKTFAGFKEENGVLIDIVAAPSVSEDAREYVKSIRKSTGIYTFGKIPKKRSNNMHIRFFDGGYVMQDWDNNGDDTKNWKVVTKKKPTKKQLDQMKIAWKFIGRIKSNTILVVDKNLPMTRGIGSGQTSRIRSAKIALEQAGELTKGAILASDSFFPFDDTVKLAAKKGIAAIVQQGGSVNDKLSIEAADKAGIPMVMTGERKFWH
ncbi:MAG: bifunctional phosphoribosylaminoimidazolecarboxamide formyltransferase/IMP cyclohydrolase [Candidatus Levyibacteriota bacterium]